VFNFVNFKTVEFILLSWLNVSSQLEFSVSILNSTYKLERQSETANVCQEWCFVTW